jgi:hypothetical protein
MCDGTDGDCAHAGQQIQQWWWTTIAPMEQDLAPIFGGEGNGYSCRLAYKISKNTYYRYRLWRLTPDSGGQWWGAWIENMTTGVDTYIGSIRVDASVG